MSCSFLKNTISAVATIDGTCPVGEKIGCVYSFCHVDMFPNGIIIDGEMTPLSFI